MVVYINKRVTDRAFEEATLDGHIGMDEKIFFKVVNELVDYYAKNKYRTIGDAEDRQDMR